MCTIHTIPCVLKETVWKNSAAVIFLIFKYLFVNLCFTFEGKCSIQFKQKWEKKTFFLVIKMFFFFEGKLFVILLLHIYDNMKQKSKYFPIRIHITFDLCVWKYCVMRPVKFIIYPDRSTQQSLHSAVYSYALYIYREMSFLGYLEGWIWILYWRSGILWALITRAFVSLLFFKNQDYVCLMLFCILMVGCVWISFRMK